MKEIWRLEKGSKEERVYKNLEKQIIRIFRHCRQGSKKSIVRYIDATKHLAKFLAVTYNKQNMNNIRNEHIEAYIEQAQEAGYSTSYIGTNLSGIRFFINQTKDSSYIKTNKELGVIPRNKEERIGPGRTWTKSEIRKMIDLAIEKDFERVADILKLSYNHGLRIHEVTRLDRVDLQRALREDKLVIKGKGGLVRNVPVRNQKSREHIQKLINQTKVGSQKVFVKYDEKTHQVIKETQNFISRYRDVIQEERGDNQANITAHGLRHTQAQERYVELRGEGLSHYDARFKLAKELGHFRVQITDVYLK